MRKYFPLILAGAIALSSCDSNRQEYREQYDKGTHIEIPVGKIGYSSERKLVSEDYRTCSALILNGQKGSTLAHVFDTSGIKKLLDAEHAVEVSLELLAKNGNPRKNVEAILIAGNPKHYKRIMDDLRNYGITVRKAEIADNNKNLGGSGYRFWAGARDVSYWPLEDKLEVTEDTFDWDN